jgi:23S rRNA (cytosine1962-C5)-methyltransferase
MEKVGESKEFFTVLEYGVKFRVNLVDYLDTGLFLDHRETRQLVAALAKDKRVLNLFAYTCSFSVQAAVAGAASTKSVDMSNTYTAWGRENLMLNSLSLQHHVIVRADCLKFLDEERRTGLKYDLIVIDPPTISRSKKMTQLFDIQVDYVPLITKALQLLSKEGVVFFSTNSRKFVLDENQFPLCKIIDISAKTIPLDFHDPKIHRCWKIISS